MTTKGMRRTMVMLLCIMHLLFFCTISTATAGDIDHLMSFKSSLLNPHLLSNWNHKHRVCEFQGVTCKEGRISSLTIRGLPLGADFNSVIAHIFSLQNLETLNLQSTNLTGNISFFPLKCTKKLVILDLSCNNLRGTVYGAASLAISCPSLQSLNLSNNFIGQGYNHSFPLALHHLKVLDLSNNMIETNMDLQLLFSTISLLQHLDLSNNSIQGTIPYIANCTSLQYLDLSSNELSGTVPVGLFSGCINLTYLNLSSNHFTGMVPPDINACTGLVTLSFSNNNFSGKIPILPKLRFLELAFNNFNGSLPNSISKIESLELLDLSANKLSGPIPGSLCTYNVSNLKVLYLQDNYLSATIPHSLSNCTNLVSLDLSLNFFSGSIPGSLGSLSNLRDLIMWQNNLHGEIPLELSSLKSLEKLLLDYNNLTGTIPDGLVNCTNLYWISLASNQLRGSMPIWIGQLEKLMILILRYNSFTGSIPLGIGDCKGLLYLDLSSNQLNGSIPPTLAKHSGKFVADLTAENWLFFSQRFNDNSRCHQMTVYLDFDGIRYNDMMRISTMRYCDFEDHSFIAGRSSQYLSNVRSIVFLDLSYNQFDGHIPAEFSAMQSLKALYLSHNHLTGPLPQEMGGMKSLLLLDLSHNLLEGSIPSSFSALSLTGLDLSNNQLSGPIPEQGSLFTFPMSAFENNSGLCGLPLPPCNNRATTSKGDGPQKSPTTTNHQYSLGKWIALGLLYSIFFIIGFVIGQFPKKIAMYLGLDYISVLY